MRNKTQGGTKIDLASFAGIAFAVAGIVGGLLLEGGEIADVRQLTAALIVLGGTIGAVMVTTPVRVLLGACKRLGDIFFDRGQQPQELIKEILDYANVARRNGIVAVEDDLDHMSDPFLKKALGLAVDGTDLQEIRKMMELEMDTEERRGLAEAKVYDAAGGYAPTIGIIGAVLGLIQVMKHLENIQLVGHGIAVAFVATVYGVGVANIFFLPAAAKIRARVEARIRTKELILEGVSSIVQGLHPAVIGQKLEAFVESDRRATNRREDRRSARPRAA